MEPEDDLAQLRISFNKIHKDDPDPLRPEYDMVQEAKRLNMSLDDYRHLYELDLSGLWFKKLLPKKLVYWLKRLAPLLRQVINASILITALTFIAGEHQRRDAAVYQAWQVVTAASGQENTGGRIKALEFLNSEPRRIPWFWLKWEKQPLAGLGAPKAYLKGIKLPGAFLSGANLEGAFLSGANLQRADLGFANLQNADLIHVNLQGAFLIGTNLQGAFLGSANLQKANMDDANLQGVTYTDSNSRNETCFKFTTRYPCPTIFPDNFDPKKAGMVLVK